MSKRGLPIFFTDKEEALFIKMGRELTENLINQQCTYYSVDIEKTESDIYGESKNKVYKTTNEVIGRIQIADADIESEGGVRRVAKGDMSLWIYLEHLAEKGIEPKVGDFIGYQGKFYEIYDAGFGKDSVDRKFAGDREFYREILAKQVSYDIFDSIEGDTKS